MPASLSGLFNLQVLTNTGAPAFNYRLYTWVQGTTTHKTAYTEAAGTVAHAYVSDGAGGLYIALNARGELPAPLFLTTGPYDIGLRDTAGAVSPNGWTRYAKGSDDLSMAAFIAAWAGAVSRNIQDKLRDFVSVLDAGADPTGGIESSADFTDAKATGKLVVRPKGTYKRFGINYTYPTDGFEGVIWIGDNTVNNSDDSQVVVSRLVNAASGGGNAHSYSDSSIYSRLNTSHNSYDDRTKTIHASAAGHHASYQVGVEIAVPGGVFGNLYSFISNPTVSAGTLTNYIALTVGAPAYSGTGAVVNCHGVYFPLGYGKGAFPFNNASGVVTAIQNESAAMIYSLGAVQGQNGLIAGNGAGTSYVNVKTIDAVTNAGTGAGLRLQQVGTNNWDLQNPASQTYLTLGDVGGEVMRWKNGGNVGVNCDPHASALLDVQSTAKGLRLPNMTTAQKTAIATPAAGLMIFDTTLAKACLYTGAAWQTITSS